MYACIQRLLFTHSISIQSAVSFFFVSYFFFSVFSLFSMNFEHRLHTHAEIEHFWKWSLTPSVTVERLIGCSSSLTNCIHRKLGKHITCSLINLHPLGYPLWYLIYSQNRGYIFFPFFFAKRCDLPTMQKDREHWSDHRNGFIKTQLHSVWWHWAKWTDKRSMLISLTATRASFRWNCVD